MTIGVEVALITLSIGLILLGLLGSIRFKDTDVGSANPWIRLIVSIFGCALLIFTFEHIGWINIYLTATGKEKWTGSWSHSFTGKDDLVFEGNLTLHVQKDSVAGSYSAEANRETRISGTLTGTANGNVITGNWNNEKDQSGTFEFTLQKDGRSFHGYYTTNSSPTLRKRWDGRK